ncbi:MAG: ABC transporter substrate-binding protein [Nitrospiraceae bacterium]|nr:ABC transporter substrate-binding protein [Nitrospiraceae bacterium]
MRGADKDGKHPSTTARYALVLAVGWTLCFAVLVAPTAAQDPEKETLETVALHLKWMHAFQFAGYYAAREQGYYREAGLEVTINAASAESQAIDTVLAGDAQYGVWGSELLNERLGGKPLVVLAVIFQHSPYVVLSREDSGIRVPSDMIGRTVMVASRQGTAQFKAMLLHEGLSPDDVTTVPNTWRIEDIINGQVDASMDYITDQPNQMRMRGVEPFLMRPIDYGIDFYGDCLFTTEAEIEQHPERVAAFRRASLKGWEYAMSHVDESIELILTLPGVQERGLTVEHLRYEAEQMRKLILPEFIEIGHSNPGRWKHIADTYVSLGMLDPDYSLEGFIYEPDPAPTYHWLYALLGGLAGIVLVAALAWAWSKQLRLAVVRQTKELRENEEKLRTIIESTGTGILVVAENGRVIHANRRFAQMWRIPEELMASGDDKRLLEFVQDQLADPETFLSKVQELYASTDEDFDTLRFKDGRMFERISHPLMHGHKIAGRVWGMIDATERRRAEEELRHLRNYLSNIIDSMPSMLVGVDPEGNVTQWNSEAQRATGVSAVDAVGQPLAQAFPRLAAEMERVREAMRMRDVRFGPRQARKEHGETRYEDVTVYPLISNGVEGAVIRVDDVTERVRIEEMMVQSEKMMSVGGLAAGMAHEINNPLAGMMQSASVLSDRLTNLELPANQRAAVAAGTTMDAIRAFMEARGVPAMLDNIRESGIRAAEIVSNMLSFARKGDSSFSSHDLAELLDQCVDLAGSDFDLEKKYDFRQIEIVREYEEDLPPIPCESGKIQQVFLNTLRNGAEAMQEAMQKGEGKKLRFILRLAYERDAGMVRIEIEDNGPGMDEATRKRVFEPFFTTKPTDQGTGLGLSVSYFIVTENHGGEMNVESTPGEGTTFIIRLPQKREQP